jgi:hypothetical protein
MHGARSGIDRWRSCGRPVTEGGHYLQRDQPQLVIDEINQVLRAVQRAAAGS